MCFTKFEKKPDEIYVHKLKSRSEWEPEPVPKLVEESLNRFYDVSNHSLGENLE